MTGTKIRNQSVNETKNQDGEQTEVDENGARPGRDPVTTVKLCEGVLS